jgi:hypothetical protein
MAYTKTSIISLAAQILGHKPVTTLDDADDLIITLEQAFDILLPSVLSTGNWRFSMQIQQLTLSTEIPPVQTGWQNIYLLPSGYLKNIRIIPQNYDYEIYNNNQIWCNWGTQTPVFMEFAYQCPVNELTPTFVNYFIWELAQFPALASAQKPDFANFIETKRVSQLAIAAATDAQNRPQFSQVNIPMLNNRNITGYIGSVAIG